MKFAHIAREFFDTRSMRFIPTGIYQWYRAFDGEQILFQNLEDIESYDILFVNLTGMDFELPFLLRKKLGDNSNTKLIACVDYGLEYWKRTLNHFEMLKLSLNCCDLVFSSEIRQKEHLEVLLEREVPLIYHPIDLEAISELRTPKRESYCTIISHLYDGEVLLPHFVFRDIPIKTQFFLPQGNAENLKIFYDRVFLWSANHDTFLERFRHSLIGFDSLVGHHNQGRFQMEGAALQIPIIGTNYSTIQKILYPELTTEPLAIKKQRKLILRLLEDEDFYCEVVEYASEKIKELNLANCKERLLKALF